MGTVDEGRITKELMRLRWGARILLTSLEREESMGDGRVSSIKLLQI